jgi:murein DD-endopeptidase MepM/ murein hydrolase activator NlpD
MNTHKCFESQPFGGNATATYVQGGLKGHTAKDIVCGFGTPITAYWGDEYVYKVLTKENPANDGSGFTGVFTICEQNGELFEFLYGHCNPTVKVGQILARGEVLGTEGNNGEVYVGQERITLEMQKAGDTRGHHRHDQKRLLKKTKDFGGTLLTDRFGIFLKDGFMYEIVNYENGYRGCVNYTLPEEQPIDTPFLNMQKAILLFQLSEGLKDFQGKPLKSVRFGPKTLLKCLKYYK